MDIIFSASILAAFLAGMVALFAPCCITILLPAYLGSAFRQKKNILKMSFVFFAGIAVILVPIGLGVAALAQVFRDFHKELYMVGGLFMLVLAYLSILSKGLSLPFIDRIKPKLNAEHPKSVFVLGMLSGAATSCCAPVLAGAMTLAALSGTFWKALIVTFSYVFGMVFPLFIAAYFYDKFKLENLKIVKGKTFNIKLGKRKLSVHSTNLFTGFIFFVAGIVMIVLALMGDAFWAPALQVKIGEALNTWSQNIFNVLENVPNFIWGSIIIVTFIFLFFKTKNKSK